MSSHSRPPSHLRVPRRQSLVLSNTPTPLARARTTRPAPVPVRASPCHSVPVRARKSCHECSTVAQNGTAWHSLKRPVRTGDKTSDKTFRPSVPPCQPDCHPRSMTLMTGSHPHPRPDSFSAVSAQLNANEKRIRWPFLAVCPASDRTSKNCVREMTPVPRFVNEIRVNSATALDNPLRGCSNS